MYSALTSATDDGMGHKVPWGGLGVGVLSWFVPGMPCVLHASARARVRTLAEVTPGNELPNQANVMHIPAHRFTDFLTVTLCQSCAYAQEMDLLSRLNKERRDVIISRNSMEPPMSMSGMHPRDTSVRAEFDAVSTPISTNATILAVDADMSEAVHQSNIEIMSSKMGTYVHNHRPNFTKYK